ncbi:hypothetical protein [Micromonospora sp. NPDC047730]|uniref:hypothetical protein n=1 Tax=Micromonospora sp. NPDC047730 TaxID=3364253 RepID=UPI003722D52A
MAKPKRLATTVYVAGRAWGPADDVPAEVAELIKNPKAWASDDVEEPTEAKAKRAGTSSGVRLASTVYVDGQAYGPNDRIPADVAARIRNPKAWEGGELPAGVEASSPLRGPEPAQPTTASAQASGGDAGATEQAAEPDAEGTATADGDSARIQAPPRAGAGSGADAWAAFAAANGVQVDADASRNDIIAACVRAGVIAEDGK